jgi:16S rRNA (adenine1518-N6/adenine1519-N6)-dimethyltransferase
MGQNLLADPLYLQKIVQSASVAPGETVVEIGAGLGVLTDALMRQGSNVIAIEVDAGFFRVLEEKFAGQDQVELIHADALEFDFRALALRIGKLRVVANLPYSISSRLIFVFHENRDVFSSLCILLQKEVAERFVAEPSTKDYGVLSVLLGISGVVDLEFDIPPKAFYPVPDVISTFVRVTFPDQPPVAVRDSATLVRLVKAAFANRRKTLRNTLRNAPFARNEPEIIVDAADAAGIDLNRRAETLTPQEFGRFADAIYDRISKGHEA